MRDILIKARSALQRHHDWQLNQTDEVDAGFEGITLIPADEYADSAIYDETVAALDLLNSEITRLTGS